MLKSFNTIDRKFMVLNDLESKKEINRDKQIEFITFRLPIEKITKELEKDLRRYYLENIHKPKISIARVDDAERLEYLYNRSWLTAGLPFRKISAEMFRGII